MFLNFDLHARSSLLALSVLFLAGSAQATLIPDMVSGPTSAGSGDFAYDYSIQLGAQERLDAGTPCSAASVAANCNNPSQSFFTLYDVGPSVISTSQPVGWGSSVQLIGKTPEFINGAFDSTSLMNVTFFYTGSAIHGSSVNGPVSGFQIVTNLDGTHMGTFSAQSTMDLGAGAGRLLQGVGPVEIPGSGQPTAVPEPITFLLMGSGLVGLALFTRKRRS